jgi:predicted Zn-dependent protease
VGALHAMQIINLGVLLPSLNNQTSSPVIMGGDTPTGQPQTTPESNLPPGENTPPIPPIAIIKDNALGNAIANLQEETPAQRTERVALERAQLPTLLASSERADWEKATKLIENSLLTESPDDMELYRSLAAAYQKLGDAERQATAQAKVDDFERRVAERAAQLVRWYEEAQQKLKTKRLGDAGEALRLSKLLLAEDPLSIPYHQLHVLSLTYLNQDAERAKAQVTLDGLILTEGQRTALAFIDQKQYDEAIDLIEKELLKRSPDNPDYLILAINAYTERNHKRDGKKIAHYQKLLEKTREGKTP